MMFFFVRVLVEVRVYLGVEKVGEVGVVGWNVNWVGCFNGYRIGDFQDYIFIVSF